MLRVGHHTSRPVSALGFAVVVESGVRQLVEWCDGCLIDLSDAGDDPQRMVISETDDGLTVTLSTSDGVVEDLGTGDTAAHALDIVLWAMNRGARRSWARGPLLHAAVLAGPRGAVVLCARSGVGKSTLAAAGALAGFTVASDDIAPLGPATMVHQGLDVPTGWSDPDLVHAYPRPVTLRPGGRVVLGHRLRGVDTPARSGDGSWSVAASSLGARIDHRPLPIREILVVRRSQSAYHEPSTRAEILHALLEHCLTLRDMPATTFERLVRLAELVPGGVLGVDPDLAALDALRPIVGLD